MRRRVLRVEGVRLGVGELRGRGGPTFVLVHGIGLSSASMEPLARRLHESGDVVLVDLPGFGDLPRPDRPLSIEDFARLVRHALRSAGVVDPVLVGHSMGAQVVVDMLVQEPLAPSAVLVGPVVNPAEPTVRRQLVRFLQVAWHEPWRVRGVAVRAYAQCGLPWFLEVLPSMMRYPMRERLPQVGAHTLVVRGELDTVTPQPWFDEVAAGLPRASAAVLPGASHNLVQSSAEACAELIVAHVRRPRTDGAPVGEDVPRHPGADGAHPAGGARSTAADATGGPRVRRSRGRLARRARLGADWVADYRYAVARIARSVLTPAPAWAAGAHHGPGAPVVLVPGIYETWRFLEPLARRLLDEGYAVHVVRGLGLNGATIRASADVVGEYVESRDLRGAVLVAHSKGGLIGKQVMLDEAERAPGEVPRVRGMVTVNTPFGGSSYARYLPVPALRALSPAAVRHLGERRAVDGAITSVHAAWDPHIPGGSALRGARNVRVDVNGHFRVLEHPRTVDAVLEAVAGYAGRAPVAHDA